MKYSRNLENHKFFKYYRHRFSCTLSQYENASKINGKYDGFLNQILEMKQKEKNVSAKILGSYQVDFYYKISYFYFQI